MTRDRMTADEAFEMLLAGNRRFVAGTPEHPNQDAARRRNVAPAQAPFAVLFGCSDSRLAAEIIFDRGPGGPVRGADRGSRHGAGGTGQH
jgi:carbonic anhydrase